jgi:hypothetical protein
MLTEDQKLNRKNVLYALRNANEDEVRFNGGIFDTQSGNKAKMCFIGFAANTLGASIQEMFLKHNVGVTQQCIDYVHEYTGWAEETLYEGVDKNDSKVSWSVIADDLEFYE